MPSEGGIIAGYIIGIAAISAVAYIIWRYENRVSRKTILHCDECNTTETFSNLDMEGFSGIYTCPECGKPRRLVKPTK